MRQDLLRQRQEQMRKEQARQRREEAFHERLARGQATEADLLEGIRQGRIQDENDARRAWGIFPRDTL